MAMSQEEFDAKKTIKSLQSDTTWGTGGDVKPRKLPTVKVTTEYDSEPAGVGTGARGNDREETLNVRYVTPMTFTPDGIEAPMYEQQLTDRAAREFLSLYDEYVISVNRHAARGDPRPAVSLIALVPVAIQRALQCRYFRGVPVTSDNLLRALRTLAGIGYERQFDDDQFVREIKQIVRMGTEPCARRRASIVMGDLFKYIEENQLYDRLYNRGAWRAGPGKVVSDALIAGVWPAPLRSKIQSCVAMAQNAVNNPDRVLDIIHDRAERWAEVEDYQLYRRQMRPGNQVARGVDLNDPQSATVGNDPQNLNHSPGSWGRRQHSWGNHEQSQSRPSNGETFVRQGSSRPNLQPNVHSNKCWRCGGAGHNQEICPSPPEASGNRPGPPPISRQGQTHTPQHDSRASPTSRSHGQRNNISQNWSGPVTAPRKHVSSESIYRTRSECVPAKALKPHVQQNNYEKPAETYSVGVLQPTSQGSNDWVPPETYSVGFLQPTNQGSSGEVPADTINVEMWKPNFEGGNEWVQEEPTVATTQSSPGVAQTIKDVEEYVEVSPPEQDEVEIDDNCICALELDQMDTQPHDASDPEVETVDLKICNMQATNVMHSGNSFLVPTILDSGSSISCVTSSLAQHLGVSRAWHNGPTVRLADGRRVQLKKKTALVRVGIPITVRDREEIYTYDIKCGILPGKSHRLLLGRHTLHKLKTEMSSRDQLPRGEIHRMGWSDRKGGDNGWLYG